MDTIFLRAIWLNFELRFFAFLNPTRSKNLPSLFEGEGEGGGKIKLQGRAISGPASKSLSKVYTSPTTEAFMLKA